MPHSPSRFLQLHTLTSYPAALLNRDDAGFAKRLPFGGSTRTRVSSQCLKRHWRTAKHDYALHQVPSEDGYHSMAIRSRVTFDKKIYQPLVDEGINEDLALIVSRQIMAKVLKSKDRAKPKKSDSKTKELQAGQVLVMGRPEVEYLLNLARNILAENQEEKPIAEALEQIFKKGDGKKNLQEIVLGSGLDAALFGRMITSDILARCDASVHVAHAFTVHAEDSESDYFSAVDDLLREEGETGSGHINSSELTSGLYYGYVVIDVPLLVSNLTGCKQADWLDADRGLAREVVQRFVHLMATVSPGAKLGSTAPYAHAQMMLVEAGDAAPRTLANAFMQPVSNTQNRLEASYKALADHLRELDDVYDAPGHGRKGLALGPKDALGGAVTPHLGSLKDLAAWTADRVSA